MKPLIRNWQYYAIILVVALAARYRFMRLESSSYFVNQPDTLTKTKIAYGIEQRA